LRHNECSRQAQNTVTEAAESSVPLFVSASAATVIAAIHFDDEPGRGREEDPSGAVFQSDKPVGLWTGNTFLSVASATSPQGGFHDSAHQQIPSVNELGTEYVGASIPTRLPSGQPESVPYRLLGVVDGTALSWESSAPVGAPLTLDQGQVADFETTRLFAVRSQDDEHPFALTQYMPGTPQTGTIDGCGAPPSEGLKCGLGDEDWINLMPAQQFLQRYVFFTDPTYATTNLAIVRTRGATGFEDVTVECLGLVDGWEPVGNGGKYEVSHTDLVRGNQALKNCATSRHVASSKGLFGLVVWGTDWAASLRVSCRR
jgi:IgGFc binding protein